MQEKENLPTTKKEEKKESQFQYTVLVEVNLIMLFRVPSQTDIWIFDSYDNNDTKE